MTSHIRFTSKVTSMILFSLVFFLQPVLARAQEPVHSLQDLASGLRKGDTIRIERLYGKSVQGKVESISGAIVKIQTGKLTEEYRESEIQGITMKYRDPIADGIKTGTIIGAVAGAVFGVVISDAFCDGCGTGQGRTALAMGLFGAGIGAGTGALADLCRDGRKLIFTTPKTTEKRYGVSPLLSKEKKGVALAFRF